MLNKTPHKSVYSQRGFTLIEIAIVILIIGVVLGMGTQFLKVYMSQLRHNTTKENIKFAQEAVYEFYAYNGRYPCPADPSLAPGDAQYGIEHCRDTAVAGCVADGVVCTDVEAGDPDSKDGADFVMIGAIPFKSLTEDLNENGVTSIGTTQSNFRAVNAYDGFGMKLTYAVSEKMADPTTNNVLQPANANLGAIKLIDENGVDLTVPEASAQYIIVSHGDNMEGAYTKNGQRMPDCTVFEVDGVTPAAPGPSPAGNASERENCDYDDALFVKGVRSLRQGNGYYDDILYFKHSGRNQLWSKVPGDLAGQSNLTNNNLGFIGVGIKDPAEMLHVDGDISAAEATYAAGYCQQDGTECFNPEDIAGTGDKCPPGHVASGMHDPFTDANGDGKDDEPDRIRLYCIEIFKGAHAPNTQMKCANATDAITGLTYHLDGTIDLVCGEVK